MAAGTAWSGQEVTSTSPQVNTATTSTFALHGSSERLVQQSGKTCAACHNGVDYPSVEHFEAESRTRYRIFWIMTAISLLIFTLGVVSKVRIWRQGQAKSLHKTISWPQVWRSLFSSVFLQRKTLKKNFWRWFIFFSISMGFIALFLASLVVGAARDMIHGSFFVEGAGTKWLDLSMDFLGLAILIGILAALVRRYLVRPPGLVNRKEDLVVLGFLFLIIATGFLLEGMRMAAHPWVPEMRYSFVGDALANLLRTNPPQWPAAHFHLWLIHAALALAFIAMMPFTKIMHFLTIPLTITATATEQPMHEYQPGKNGKGALPLGQIGGEVQGR